MRFELPGSLCLWDTDGVLRCELNVDLVTSDALRVLSIVGGSISDATVEGVFVTVLANRAVFRHAGDCDQRHCDRRLEVTSLACRGNIEAIGKYMWIWEI